MQRSNKGNSTSRSKCHFGFLHHDFLHDKKILYPANQHPFTVGFSDSCCCEIFSICLHSARPSAHSFWHRRGARRTSAGECRRLKVIQRATPQPSRGCRKYLVAAAMKAGRASRPRHHRWQAMETQSKQTMAFSRPADITKSTIHTRMVLVHVFSRFLSGSYPGSTSYVVYAPVCVLNHLYPYCLTTR